MIKATFYLFSLQYISLNTQHNLIYSIEHTSMIKATFYLFSLQYISLNNKQNLIYSIESPDLHLYPHHRVKGSNKHLTLSRNHQLCNWRLWKHPLKKLENLYKCKYNCCIDVKMLWKKKKLHIFSNFSFCHNIFKSHLLQMRQNVST